jgi:hypothetical protein
VNTVVLVTGLLVVALVVVMVRVDTALLRDLADTPDQQLQMMTRKGWAAAIIFAFPIGAILYLRYGKVR